LAQQIAAGSLGPAGAKVTVDWAMRYGQPSIRYRMLALQGAGCERILLVPLYPHMRRRRRRRSVTRFSTC